MRKKILLMLSAFCFMGATVFGQAIEGGAGIIHVTGDPNENVLLNVVTENEGNMAYDADNQTAYFYNPAGTAAIGPFPGGTAGTRWVPVDISGLVDPITSIVVDAAGSPELTAVTVGGVTTLSFESDATISYVPGTNTLTFTDVDGHDTDVDLSGLNTPVSAADPSITVTNVGTAANPDYEISVTGANGATSGTVPVTDGTTGALTWTEVVESITVDPGTIDGAGEPIGAGRIMIKPTTGPAVPLNLDDLPEVANMGDVTQALANISSGESAFVKAAANNTFGMPATGGFGVIFVIEKP